MQKSFTLFFLLALIILLVSPFNSIKSQSIGDYRSNLTSGNLWSTAANWETYDGSTWITAGTAPSNIDNVITIRSGDSIALTSATSIDQVQIEAGGILAIFAASSTTFDLDNGTGDDIINNGKLYIGANSIVDGTGTVKVNATGTFILFSNGRVRTAISNDGYTYVTGAPVIQNTTFVNNGSLEIASSTTLFLNAATLTNNDSIYINSAATAIIIATTATVVNTSTGVIYKEGANTSFTIGRIANSGKIQGYGTYAFSNVTSNTGIIETGNPIGVMAVNPLFLTTGTTSRATNIIIEVLNGSGAAAGGHDSLVVKGTVGTTNDISLSNATLTLIDNASAPIGTYTIMTTTTINPTGPTDTRFIGTPILNIPSNYTYLGIINDTTIQVQKTAVLPVVWGYFNVHAKNNQAVIAWSTLQEVNTSHFIVEHSVDGAHFSTIATISAKGNSSGVTEYKFTHLTPSLISNNYYRILQVDIDGKSTYSSIKMLGFRNGEVVKVQIGANPVQNGNLQLSVQEKEITIILVDAQGNIVKRASLQQGLNQIDINTLLPGIYNMIVYQKQQRISTQRIVKQ